MIRGTQTLADLMSGNQSWPRPIPVSERLPEDDIQVLGYYPRGLDKWRRIWFCGYRKEWIDGEFQEVGKPYPTIAWPTHWLPLPPNPE